MEVQLYGKVQVQSAKESRFGSIWTAHFAFTAMVTVPPERLTRLASTVTSTWISQVTGAGTLCRPGFLLMGKGGERCQQYR